MKDNQGQLIITAGQIVWTAECEKALSGPEGAKHALRHLKKKWVSYLDKLTAITRSNLSKIERNKVSTQYPWCYRRLLVCREVCNSPGWGLRVGCTKGENLVGNTLACFILLCLQADLLWCSSRP